MKRLSLAASAAAFNSSLGRVNCFSGAVQDFDITSKVQLLSCWIYAAAPYVLVLASAETWRIVGAPLGAGITALYLQGKDKDLACVILVEIICHLSWRFVFSICSVPIKMLLLQIVS